MGNNKSATALESATEFYCVNCETVQPLKDKPRVTTTQGEYVICEGHFVCEKCKSRRSVFCAICNKVQPVEVQTGWVRTHDDFLGADVLCSACRSILAILDKHEKRIGCKRSAASTSP